MVSTRRVTSADGVGLAVDVHGDPAAPTIVCIHGYPDNRTVWDGVVGILARRFRVVTYDVRGFGDSDVPKGRASYTLDKLEQDLKAVVDEVAPAGTVHLLAHDWGAIQTWQSVTGELLRGRIASFTSVSGPSLDHAGRWFRTRPFAGPGGLRSGAAQLADSWYTIMFQLPVLPELAVRAGILDAALGRLSKIGQSSVGGRQEASGTQADKINGINLYRANMVPRALTNPKRRRVHDIPIQIVAPAQDPFVSTALQTEAPLPWARDVRVRRIAGGHWVVTSRPDVIARLTTELVDSIEGVAPEPRGLVNARVEHGTRRRPFHRQLVVLTGGGGGIGRETALEFARQGADVVIADIDDDAAARTADDVRGLGSEAWSFHLDVADAEGFDAFAKRVREEIDVPDVVVNNAGLDGAHDPDGAVDADLWSVIHGCRLFGAQLIERGQGGTIVNLFAAGEAGEATRAAVLMLTETVRPDLGRDGVGVTAVSFDARFPQRSASRIVRETAATKPVVATGPQVEEFRSMSRYTPALMRQFSNDV